MTSLVFPDVNVWFALNYEGHTHFETSDAWFNSLDEASVLYFCRHTQMGLFRLLSNPVAIPKETRTQRQCWEIYETYINNGRSKMLAEPYELERYFKSRTSSEHSSTKEWADAYLAAFAEAAQLQLVTFDKALAGKSKGAILLG
jgi:toxin-antitoxin system PIN domain toxin